MKTLKNIQGLAFFLAAAFLLVSCAGNQIKKREAHLSKAVRSYNESIRWQRYGVASRFVEEKLKNQFLEKFESQRETYNVTDVEIASAALDEEDDTKGTARVWVSYFRYPGVGLKKDLQVQTWRYNPEKQTWKIDLPELKPEKK